MEITISSFDKFAELLLRTNEMKGSEEVMLPEEKERAKMKILELCYQLCYLYLNDGFYSKRAQVIKENLSLLTGIDVVEIEFDINYNLSEYGKLAIHYFEAATEKDLKNIIYF